MWRRTYKIIGVLLSALFIISSCRKENKVLPVLGEREVVNGDTLFHTIPDFQFWDQDSNRITNETVNDKIYVVDFFFTSCPTICPKVKKNMMRVNEKYMDRNDFLILSHSIDTKRDSVPRLKEYATKIGIEGSIWHLLTGTEDDIYGINEDYFIAAMVDEDAPGGFNHSGNVVLVDKQRRIRSFCDGTDAESVDDFMKDIDVLLNE